MIRNNLLYATTHASMSRKARTLVMALALLLVITVTAMPQAVAFSCPGPTQCPCSNC